MQPAFAMPMISIMLLMFLVVWTGTAWFIALHARFVWSMLERRDWGHEAPPFDQRALRFGAVLYGAAGLVLIVLADLYT